MSETIYSNKISQAGSKGQDETAKQKLAALKRELEEDRMRQRAAEGKGVAGLKAYFMTYEDTTIRDALMASMQGDKRAQEIVFNQKVDKLLKVLSKYFGHEEMKAIEKDCRRMSEEEIDAFYQELKYVIQGLNSVGLEK